MIHTIGAELSSALDLTVGIELGEAADHVDRDAEALQCSQHCGVPRVAACQCPEESHKTQHRRRKLQVQRGETGRGGARVVVMKKDDEHVGNALHHILAIRVEGEPFLIVVQNTGHLCRHFQTKHCQAAGEGSDGKKRAPNRKYSIVTQLILTSSAPNCSGHMHTKRRIQSMSWSRH